MKNVEDRFSPSRIRQIKKGLKNGAKVEEAHTVEEIRDFSRMLHKVYSSRIRRYFPANDFFRHMNSMLIRGKQAKIFIVPSFGFQEECERHTHCNIPVYWLFGKHWKMPINAGSATWNSWM